MSDYLQRLVRRAIPTPNVAPEKLPEVRPATSLYRPSTVEMQDDFELEMAEPGGELHASRPISNPSQDPESHHPVGPDQSRKNLEPLDENASPNVLLRPISEPAPALDATSGPALFDVRPEEITPGQAQSAIETVGITESKGDTATEELAGSRNTSPATEIQQAEPALFTGIAFPSPDDSVEEAQQIQYRPIAPTSQPAPGVVASESWRGAQPEDAPDLEPQIPTPIETNPSTPESQRVVIGSLTVEVLPASPSPQAVQPAVQVTQIVQPAPARYNRSSKLRFGLGQM